MEKILAELIAKDAELIAKDPELIEKREQRKAKDAELIAKRAQWEMEAAQWEAQFEAEDVEEILTEHPELEAERLQRAEAERSQRAEYEVKKALWEAEYAEEYKSLGKKEHDDEGLRLQILRRINIIRNEIKKKLNIHNNILNIMEIYDILQPILKEKYIIKKILQMKYDMDICKLRVEKEKLDEMIGIIDKYYISTNAYDNFDLTF